MEISPASLRPCTGYILWLTLQCLARLILTQSELYVEKWLMLAAGVLWGSAELSCRFLSWKSSKTLHHSTAHGIALGLALAGLCIQKALFVTTAASRPSERSLLLALGETSKLSLILFRLPAAELLLLLLVDSLLQLLVIQQYNMTVSPDFPGGFSVLLVADLLFLAIPLLHYVFGPWPSTAQKSGIPKRHRPAEREDNAASTTTAALLAALGAAIDKPDCSDVPKVAELLAFLPNLTPCPSKLVTTSTLFSVPESTLRGAGRFGMERSTSAESVEGSVEQLLTSLASILSKKNSGVDDNGRLLFRDAFDDVEPLCSRENEEQRCSRRKTGKQTFPREIISGSERIFGAAGPLQTDLDTQKADRGISSISRQEDGPTPHEKTSVRQSSHFRKVETDPCYSPETGSSKARTPLKSPVPSLKSKSQANLTREDLLKYLQEDQKEKTKEQRRFPGLEHSESTKDKEESGLRGAAVPVSGGVSGSQSPLTRESLPGIGIVSVTRQPLTQKAKESELHGEAASSTKKGQDERVSKESITSNRAEGHHRQQRVSSGSVVFCDGGTKEDVKGIASSDFRRVDGKVLLGRGRELTGGSFSSTVASSTAPSTQQDPGHEKHSEHDSSIRGGDDHSHEPALKEKKSEAFGSIKQSGSGSSSPEWKRTGLPCRRRSSKLLTVPLDPTLPIVLQSPPLETEVGDRNEAFDPLITSSNSDFLHGRGVQDDSEEHDSHVLRAAVLDPYASPLAHTREAPSVFWGRSGAFGASGTPMVSPRLLAGPCGLGKGVTVDDIAVGRQMELPFGTERHFQRSPHMALRSVGGWGDRGTVADWRDRGEQVNAGSKQFFGTPSLPLRDSRLESASNSKVRDDIQKLRDFAIQRRGRDVTSRALPHARPAQRASGLHGSAARQSPPLGCSGEPQAAAPLAGSRRGSGEHTEGVHSEWAALMDSTARGKTHFPERIAWPHIARQDAVGASGTPMMTLRSLDRGVVTPQYPSRTFLGQARESEYQSYENLPRKRCSLGSEGRDMSDPSRHYYRSIIAGSRNPWEEGWDPLTQSSTATPGLVAEENGHLQGSSTAKHSGGWQGESTSRSQSSASSSCYSGMRSESSGSNKNWLQGSHWPKTESKRRINEGEEYPSSPAVD